MNYRNTEMKLDALVGYLNDNKINLNPVFQRGQVWPIGTRRKLVENMVQGRPIPAIFLYKEAAIDSSRYSYNILDGKQRLESLILFIASQRGDIFIKNWTSYFFPSGQRRNAKFWVQMPEGKKTFAALDPSVVRDFREYSIPTIEITLSEGSRLDEIISLFVDINTKGVQVNRFSVVKAMGRSNRLLNSVFELIAIKQKRGNATFYKSRSGDVSHVLKVLEIVNSASDVRVQVDRMWERLLEIALFFRTRRHRKPVDILKSFISAGGRQASAKTGTTLPLSKLTAQETQKIGNLFRFLATAYKTTELRDTIFAKDQTHFYTLVTSLISTDLMTKFPADDLARKLISFSGIIAGKSDPPKEQKKAVTRYVNLSSDRTTDSDRREERQRKFVEVVSAL